MNKLDLTVVQKYVDDKYISVQKHPNADLYIYNYTQKCQFDRNWDEITTREYKGKEEKWIKIY